MSSTTALDHAIEVASKAHAGQTDKLGNPYIQHCRRVAFAVSGQDRKIVAYLHDVVEKARAGPSIASIRKVFLQQCSQPSMRSPNAPTKMRMPLFAAQSQLPSRGR